MPITIHNERLSGAKGYEPVALISYAFTTDADGDASETSETVNGQINRIVTNPASGDDKPSANWDLTILDEDGVDILGGNGANRDAGGAAVSEQAAPSVAGLGVQSTLTFTVEAGGNTKKGVVNLYFV
jgi:hypothetical protein